MEKFYDNEAMLKKVNEIDESSLANPPMMIKLQISNVDTNFFNYTKFEYDIDTFLVFRLYLNFISYI